MMISERIFLIMEKTGMSQQEFARKTGIAQSTVCDWKRKKTNPAADKIMIICEALGVSPYELLSGAENSKFEEIDHVTISKRSDEYKVIEKYLKLDYAKKERLIGYLDALAEK